MEINSFEEKIAREKLENSRDRLSSSLKNLTQTVEKIIGNISEKRAQNNREKVDTQFLTAENQKLNQEIESHKEAINLIKKDTIDFVSKFKNLVSDINLFLEK